MLTSFFNTDCRMEHGLVVLCFPSMPSFNQCYDLLAIVVYYCLLPNSIYMYIVFVYTYM